MQKRDFLLLILCFCSVSFFAQVDHQKMFDAYLKGDLSVWGEMLKEKQKNIQSLSEQELAEVINYQYGYIPWCLETKKNRTSISFSSTF